MKYVATLTCAILGLGSLQSLGDAEHTALVGYAKASESTPVELVGRAHAGSLEGTGDSDTPSPDNDVFITRLEEHHQAAQKTETVTAYEAKYRKTRRAWSSAGAPLFGTLLGTVVGVAAGMLTGNPWIGTAAGVAGATGLTWLFKKVTDPIAKLWTRIRHGKAPEGTTFGAPPALVPEPVGVPTQYPIVLVHGLQGSLKMWDFRDGPEALGGDCEKVDTVLFCEGGGDGHRVMVAQLPPYGSVEERAQFLAEQVDAALKYYGTDKVNIIAHSMGGLDSRCLVSSEGECDQGKDYGDKVASITTIATPHHGTRLINRLDKVTPQFINGPLERVLGWMGYHSDLGDQISVDEMLHDLSTDGAAEFNREHPLDSRVQYFSWGGLAAAPWQKANSISEYTERDDYFGHAGGVDTIDPIMWALVPLLGEDGDGLVPAASARLEGDNAEFLGYIPADHADQINSKGVDDHSGFDSVAFLRNMAFDLADWGY